MIHLLRVKNFYSFRDEVEIDLTYGAPAPEYPGQLAPIYQSSGIFAPRVVGVFGPNASGKSNLLRAISFVSWFIQNSFAMLQPGMPLPCFRFNTRETQESPIEITIGFCAPTNLGPPSEDSRVYSRYEYSITLDGGTQQPTRVAKESLFYWPPGARRSRVFEREAKLVQASQAFHIRGYTRPLSSVLRPNASLIATLVQLGHAQSITLRDLAQAVYFNIFFERVEFVELQIAQQYFNDKQLIESLNREIQRLDLGIKEINFAKPEGQNFAVANFVHVGLSNPIPGNLESHGTRQFVRIFPLISAALKTGGVAVVDEIDSSIHPFVLPEIIRWFYKSKRNPKNAQLWFTCQNPYLLTTLAKEQIVFCEKDYSGSTTAFGLTSIKAVRRQDNYVDEYLSGAYGAVPHVG